MGVNISSVGPKTTYGQPGDHMSQQIVKSRGKCEIIKYRPVGAGIAYSSIFAQVHEGKFITKFRLPIDVTNVEICYGSADHGKFESLAADTWHAFNPQIVLPMDKEEPFFFNADQQITSIELLVISDD
jgi:hypothetical protein